MHTMSDVEDESFIVLGSSPTPSMEQYVSGNEQRQESMTNKRCAQTISNNFSLVRADDPLKSSIMMTAPQSIQSVQSASTTASINGSNSQSASVIMGNIKTSSLQNFPSEMRSSLPIVESQLAQHLTNGHEQLKEYVEMTNVALRESLASLQKWHEENNAKHKYNQVEMNDEQTAIIDQLKEENYKLKQLFRTAETRATEQEKRAFEQEKRATEQEMRATEQEERAVNLEIALERAVDEAKNQIQAERVSALAEMEELNKNVSERETILKNIIDQHKEENYKLEKLVQTAENQAKEQEKRATEQEMRAFEQEERAVNLEIALERAVDEAKNQIQAERFSALAEIDELKKNVSEKEPILKNTIDQHKEENHRLEQLVRTAETRAKEQEKRAVELEKCLTEQEKRFIELEMRTTEQEKLAANLEITLERALTEMDELKKNVSEKESILKNITDQLKEENHRLEQLVRTAETQATEQEKRATELEKRAANLEITLERAVDEAKNQIEAERVSALAEMEELKKNVSERETILNNIIDQHKEENHRLEQFGRTAKTRAREQEQRATDQEMRATEQEKRAANLEITLERAVDEAKNQIQAERVSALAEMEELNKNVSERETVLKNIIDQHKEENHRLEQLVRTAETRATEQEKHAANLEIMLERAVHEAKNQIQAERVSALAEMEELKKNVSERESILKNIIDQLVTRPL